MSDTVQLMLQHFAPEAPRLLITGSRQYKRQHRVREWIAGYARPFVLAGSRLPGVESAAERAAHARGLQVLVYQDCERGRAWEHAHRVIVFWDEVDREGLGMIREAARLSKLWLVYGATGARMSEGRVRELVA